MIKYGFFASYGKQRCNFIGFKIHRRTHFFLKKVPNNACRWVAYRQRGEEGGLPLGWKNHGFLGCISKDGSFAQFQNTANENSGVS